MNPQVDYRKFVLAVFIKTPFYNFKSISAQKSKRTFKNTFSKTFNS